MSSRVCQTHQVASIVMETAMVHLVFSIFLYSTSIFNLSKQVRCQNKANQNCLADENPVLIITISINLQESPIANDLINILFLPKLQAAEGEPFRVAPPPKLRVFTLCQSSYYSAPGRYINSIYTKQMLMVLYTLLESI